MGLKTAFGGHDGFPRWIVGSNQVTQHLKLSPDDFTGGIERFVGRSLAGWVETRAAPPHQFQKRCPATGFLQGRHHHQQWPSFFLCQGAGHESTTDPTGPPQQQPCITFGALQQFASEGC